MTKDALGTRIGAIAFDRAALLNELKEPKVLFHGVASLELIAAIFVRSPNASKGGCENS
jgi:hypothetical protein